MAIGTETGGSNVFPASVNGLYGLTLPHGSVPIDGVSRISEFTDRLGLMARDPQDIISLANLLLADRATAIQDEIRLQDTWKGLSIGIFDSEWGIDPSSSWKWGSTEVVRTHAHSEPHFQLTMAQKEKYVFVAKRLKRLGAKIVFPLENPPQPDMMEHNGERLHSISCQCRHEHWIHPIFEPSLNNLVNIRPRIRWCARGLYQRQF